MSFSRQLVKVLLLCCTILNEESLLSRASFISSDSLELGLTRLDTTQPKNGGGASQNMSAAMADSSLEFEIPKYKEQAPDEDSGRMVILRTFCPFDIDALASGFDDWVTFFPCESQKPVDILLYFSQDWALWPKAKSAADDIVRKFDEGHYPWSVCFGTMSIGTAAMPPSEDFYAPPQQQTNRLWVNGPNRQFEAGLRASQGGDWQLAYLMEPDSVPLKSFWLDTLLAEVDKKRPFAVLGSKYRGDKWYSFLAQLEVPLLNHINGNAIYNVSHQLMNLMLGQLEREKDQLYNIIPFDLRMGQMWSEGALGITQNMWPDLGKVPMKNAMEHVVTPRNNTALFRAWWNESGFNGGPNGTSPTMAESVSIKNYAATNMLPKYLGPEILIHGAAMFKRWEGNVKPISLVVSDWDEGFLDEFLLSLSQEQHPFTEVVVMRPPYARKVPHRRLDRGSRAPAVTVRMVYRDAADYMDVCSAPVENEWFMFTNTYHSVRRTVDLLLTLDDSKPLVSYIYAELPFCSDYVACASAVSRARSLYDPDLDKYVADMEVPYHAKELGAFCEDWKAKNVPLLEESCVPQGPTATSFLAYLNSKGIAKKLYKLKDKAQYGYRDIFKHTHESLNPDSCLPAGVALNGTLLEKTCEDLEDEASCLASGGPTGDGAGPTCSWDAQFSSCFRPGTVLSQLQGKIPFEAAKQLPSAKVPPDLQPTDDQQSDDDLDPLEEFAELAALEERAEANALRREADFWREKMDTDDDDDVAIMQLLKPADAPIADVGERNLIDGEAAQAIFDHYNEVKSSNPSQIPSQPPSPTPLQPTVVPAQGVQSYLIQVNSFWWPLVSLFLFALGLMASWSGKSLVNMKKIVLIDDGCADVEQGPDDDCGIFKLGPLENIHHFIDNRGWISGNGT